MFRKFPATPTFVTGLLGFPLKDPDHVDVKSKYAQSIFSQDPNETGSDRLYMMYSTDEFGSTSPEMVSILQATMTGLFAGACIGGFIHSRNAYMQFMERNQATVFKTHFEAKKKLQDTVTVAFGKGAFQWGWRLSLFSGSYVLITTSISVYRGKSSILEYLVAGGLTGAAYKSSLGPRGILVGGLLGSFLGGVAGGISLGILKLAGLTMEEVRYWQYSWKTSRYAAMREIEKIRRDENTDPLLIHHDSKIPPATGLKDLPETMSGDTSTSKGR